MLRDGNYGIAVYRNGHTPHQQNINNDIRLAFFKQLLKTSKESLHL